MTVMNPSGQQILIQLARVEALRRERLADPALSARLRVVKEYQARRFGRTYADLLRHPRYRGAAKFFLDDLYGPQEFAARDAQFARIVPALVRMFPDEIVRTVSTLAQLHALSEELDEAMARALREPAIDPQTYRTLWRTVGRPEDRQLQIEMTIRIGEALDRYTRSAMLRGALRVMRKPAQAAGLGDLQRFLEAGFDTFGAMRGAREFLSIVRDREQTLAAALFQDAAVTSATTASGDASKAFEDALGQLP